MRRFGFAVDDCRVQIGEACLLEIAAQFKFGETEPDVGIYFSGFFELMTKKIENRDAPAGFEDAPRFGNGALGMLRVMQRLAEECQIRFAIG